MKYVTFAQSTDLTHPRLGVLIGEAIVDLDELRTWAQGARSIPGEDLPESMMGMIYAGSHTWEYVSQLVQAIQGEDPLRMKGAHRKPIGYPQEQVFLYPPLPNPESVRDFFCFESHVKNVFELRGKEVPHEWYEMPVFYFSNPHAIFGHASLVPYPHQSEALDFELEIACVIGKAGKDISAEEAEDYIFGFTIFNDWSARDIQQKEMRVGLGPAKSKDFASSLGPWIVTRDELHKRTTGRSGVYDLSMQARVNNQQKTLGNWKDIHYSFGEMIAAASKSAYLLPGEVICSGTVGNGCLLETTQNRGPWLKPGDIVELEVEELGILSNQVGPAEE